MRKQILFRGEPLYFYEKGKGRAMVLLHGFLGSADLWEKLSPRWAKRFRVIQIELPGHGSSAALGYVQNMELMAEAVQAVISELKLRTVVLVGHSLGGYVALAFAEAYPDLLRGLILINSSAKGDSKERKMSRDKFAKLLKENKDRALRQLVPTFFQSKQRGTHWKVKKYLQWARACSLQGIIATVEGMKRRKEREIILKFSPYPYLYLIGEKDPLFNIDEGKKEASLGERGDYKILKKASHMAPLEDPEAVYKWVKEFSRSN
ncbi:MAG: alpha/beta hydrolase [Vicingaceae bacterium]